MMGKNKKSGVLIILIFVLTPMIFTYAQSLKDYQWKNRLLFVLNPDGNSPLSHPQLVAFKDRSAAVEERQLLIMVLHHDKLMDIHGNELKQDPGDIPFNDFKGVILIGKDGGVKLKEPFTVDPEVIFNLIDSMPMRRAEIKNSEKY